MGDRTRKTVFAAMFLAAAMNATVAAAASFDCAQALSATERLICSDASLGARDVILSRLYVAAIRKDPTGRIKAGQREWLAKAGTCGTAACLGKMYEGQIDRLLRTKGGNAAASHFFTEEPKGNHGTLDVVGPTDGFAYVSLVSTYVGPGGVEGGNVNVGNTAAFVDLREGRAEFTDFGTRHDGGCIVTVNRIDVDHWKVDQRGSCDLSWGTLFAGTYQR